MGIFGFFFSLFTKNVIDDIVNKMEYNMIQEEDEDDYYLDLEMEDDYEEY